MGRVTTAFGSWDVEEQRGRPLLGSGLDCFGPASVLDGYDVVQQRSAARVVTCELHFAQSRGRVMWVVRSTVRTIAEFRATWEGLSEPPRLASRTRTNTPLPNFYYLSLQ